MGRQRAAVIIIAVLLTSCVALLLVRSYQLQTGRSALRKKLAPLELGLGDFSPREAVQVVKYIRIDAIKYKSTLSDSERRKLQDLLNNIAAWSYFMEQSASAMPVTTEARRYLTKASVNPADVSTSPALEEFLRMKAKQKLYTDLARAKDIPAETAWAELRNVEFYFRVLHPTPPEPDPNFYSPRAAAEILASQISSNAASIKAELERRRWF